jgi:hypothetical protein
VSIGVKLINNRCPGEEKKKIAYEAQVLAIGMFGGTK